MTSTHTFTQIDVTSTDVDEIARLWSEEVTETRSGHRALYVKEHAFIRQNSGGKELGEPGMVLVTHAQRMERHFMHQPMYEFIFGEKVEGGL